MPRPVIAARRRTAWIGRTRRSRCRFGGPRPDELERDQEPHRDDQLERDRRDVDLPRQTAVEAAHVAALRTENDERSEDKPEHKAEHRCNDQPDPRDLARRQDGPSEDGERDDRA